MCQINVVLTSVLPVISSAAGDWVNCGICGEWAHFGCDRRQGLGAFKVWGRNFIRAALEAMGGFVGSPKLKVQMGEYLAFVMFPSY